MKEECGVTNKRNEPRSGCSIALMLAVFFAVSLIAGMAIGVYLLAGEFQNTIAASEAGTFDIAAFVSSVQNNPLMKWLTVFTNIVAFFAIIALFKILYKRPLKQMGFGANKWCLKLLVGAAAGIIAITACVAIFVATGMGQLYDFDISRAASVDFLYYVPLYISVGFIEEEMSRGFMMTALKTLRNKWLMVIISSLFFSALHLSNPNFGLLPFINIFLVGVAFAYMFIKSGSIWFPIGYHIAWNFFQGAVYGIEVSGNTNFSLSSFSLSGFELFTGGDFGAEGGLVCTFVTMLVIVFVHFCVKEPNPGWTIDGDLPLTKGVPAPAPIASS
jgi:membrane protease YdiL (CAAX protease family)